MAEKVTKERGLEEPQLTSGLATDSTVSKSGDRAIPCYSAPSA